MKKIELDDYEKEIAEAFEKGELTSIQNMEQEIKKHRKWAAEFNRAQGR